MNLPVKQHIIPQTYLKYFSSDEKSIWLYQKDNKHFREQSIRKVPIVKDFYTVIDKDNNGEKLYLFEDFLAKTIEPLYRPYISKIYSGEKLNYEQKGHFAFFISAQKLRTVKMRELIINEIECAFKHGKSGDWFDKSYLNRLTQNFYEGETKITTEEFIEKSAGRLSDVSLTVSKDCFVQFLPVKISEFAEQLAELNWSYLYAPNKRSFVTTDSPVILDSEFSDSSLPFKGGIFPLTKDLALNINSEQETIRGLGASEMRKINQLLISQSHRYVFSHDERLLRSTVQKYI